MRYLNTGCSAGTAASFGSMMQRCMTQEDDVFYVLLMDVTEKKSMEYQMGKLQAVLQHIPNEIAISGADGRMECTKMWNFDRECSLYRPSGHRPKNIGRSGGWPSGWAALLTQLWNEVQQGQVVSYETWGRQEALRHGGMTKIIWCPFAAGEGEIVDVGAAQRGPGQTERQPDPAAQPLDL